MPFSFVTSIKYEDSVKSVVTCTRLCRMVRGKLNEELYLHLKEYLLPEGRTGHPCMNTKCTANFVRTMACVAGYYIYIINFYNVIL